RIAKEIDAPAKHHKLTADVADRLAVVLAKIGYRFEIRCQAASQPDELDVALALPLKAPTRLNTIEIAIDVDLQQCRGMISRPTGRVRLKKPRSPSRSSSTKTSIARTGLSSPI